ncbi:hypothetical protein [Nitrosovibrio sp. Nv4]|nr:hypothetical protein SAMN06298226_2729 [Nitrosovibrio sp. Nv4]
MFHSAHSALAWAYQVSATPIVKLSSVNAMCGTPRRSGQNLLLSHLSVHEQHAQAAAIIGIAERLEDPAYREYIAARFGGMTKPEDVTVMMNRIFQALGTGIHGRRGAYKLLLCYFGKTISHKSIRYDLACGNDMVVAIRRGVYNMLDVIHSRAMADMAEDLESHGLIAREWNYA